jgi:hypothetical protein
MKRILRTLLVVAVVYAAASTAHAQGPGAGNPRPGRPAGGPPGMNGLPPAVPGNGDQENRQDKDNPFGYAHIVAHGLSHSNHPSAALRGEHMKNLHTPIVVPPKPMIPVSEWHYTPPRFAPAVNEGIPSMARGFSSLKGGGILTGIGGAIAALFGGLFGRKKES